MRRRLLTLVIFVLLGAVLNVAVAWGCALGLPVLTANGPTARSSAMGDRAPYWGVEQLQRPGATRYVWMYVPFDFGTALSMDLGILVESEPVDLDGLPRWSRLDYSKPPLQKYRGWDPVFIDDARGWPLLAVSSFSALGIDPVTDAFWIKCSGGFSVPDSSRSQALFVGIIEDEWFNRPIVPVRPIWPGFAVNTLFYAAILWPPILGPFALRRHLRRKRGLCVACGYDLRGNLAQGCPECGWQRETAS